MFAKLLITMNVYLISGQELFGTVIYKPEKIMVIVLDDLNEDTLMRSPAAQLLSETVIDLVSKQNLQHFSHTTQDNFPF